MGENGNIKQNGQSEVGSFKVKAGLAQMLKGGVIMDVVTPDQAVIAEEAGACAVMALERVPADIRQDGGVARMSDPGMIKEIIAAVSIPVMAKARIGHFGEARVIQSIGVDCIDESEVLTVADTVHHIRKSQFKIPFVCGAEDLGSALRRIAEGARYAQNALLQPLVLFPVFPTCFLNVRSHVSSCLNPSFQHDPAQGQCWHR